MNRIVMSLILVASLSFVACSSGSSESTPAATETPATTETPPAVEAPAAEAPAAEAPAAGGGGVCGKAKDCCAAFVAAMPGGAVTAEQACAGIEGAAAAGAAGDSACQQMIDGWKQSLTAMNVAVPAACN